ncbi:MAG TPA: AMP-binding protein [Terriglobales bacterium]|nr:AMP-binding protein [Terriglobales bacterium]
MSTFYDRFLECAERWPGNVALEIQRRDSLESYRYADVRQISRSIAAWMVANGYEQGTRAAILANNHPHWVTTYLGIIAAGCVAVPLDTAFTPEQVAKLLEDSGSTLLFCDDKHSAVSDEAVKKITDRMGTTDSGRDRIRVIRLGHGFPTAPERLQLPTVSTDDLAALLYTSGTTADPKGVMLTHANLMGEAEAVFGWAHLGPGDVLLGVLPLFHALAQMANLLLPLVSGSRVVYLESLSSEELLRALRERNITAFACVPQFFYLIHERIQKELAKRGKLAQLGAQAFIRLNRLTRAFGWNSGKLFFRPIHRIFGNNMRYLVTGGSRWDPKIGWDFYSLGIDILQAYGLTETSGGAFATPPNQNVIGSVGKPLRGVEAKLLDPQLQDGHQVGEIAIRGSIVMKGYWNRPDATGEVLNDGWLNTGDLGYFDEKGNLFITGRKKEVIVLSSGKNIYPEEIESHYLKSPFIKEVCVLGLTGRPGEPFSERLHAVVVPDFDVLRQRKIVNAKEVIRFDIEGLSQKLPSTKRILSYEIWQSDLPRTTTRKLRRFEIEKRVRENQTRKLQEAEIASERPPSAEEQSWFEQPYVTGAVAVIQNAAKAFQGRLRPDHNLELDLGFDSMQRVELLVALEQAVGGKVDESRLSEIYTVRELVDAVRQSKGNGAAARTPSAAWEAILSEETQDPEVLALGKDRPFSAAVLFLAFRFVQVVARDLFRLHVTGLEKVPSRGPFIISPNHQSFIDPFLVGSVMPWQVFREIFSVGTSEIFGSGLMRRIARFMRVIVVDPDSNLIPAMRAGAFGLRRGRVLMLFPEGERSIDGTPKVFKKGAAILSAHLRVPIVPVAIEGAYEVWPRGKKFFQTRHPVKLAFGHPIYPPVTSHPGETEYAQLTAELRERVMEMWMELGRPNRQRQAQAAD